MAISPWASIDESNPYPSYRWVEMRPILATLPQFTPLPMPGDEDDIGQAERADSVFPIPSTPAGKSRKKRVRRRSEGPGLGHRDEPHRNFRDANLVTEIGYRM